MPIPTAYKPAIGIQENYLTDFRTGLAHSNTDLGGGKVGVDVNIANISGSANAAQETGGNLAAARTDLDYRFSGGKTPFVATISASGNADLIVPANGHHLEVYWVAFVPDSDNTTANLLDIGFGTSGGAIVTPLYRGYALAHWELFVGSTNQALIITTTNSQPVAVVVHYKAI